MSETDDRFTYSARCTRVIDGDTIEVVLVKHETIDWGFKIKTTHGFEHTLRVRLEGINTPETRGRKAKTEGVAGRAATAYAISWFKENCQVDADGAYLIWLRSHDGKALAPGKYHGRWIAEVWPRDREGKSLNEALLDTGHAVVYPG